MSLYLENLDPRTRRLMLEELDYDIAHNQLHISPLLSGQGQRDYPNLLRETIQGGDDVTLAQALRAHRRITRTLPRRKPDGGFSLASSPQNAAQIVVAGQIDCAHSSAADLADNLIPAVKYDAFVKRL